MATFVDEYDPLIDNVLIEEKLMSGKNRMKKNQCMEAAYAKEPRPDQEIEFIPVSDT